MLPGVSPTGMGAETSPVAILITDTVPSTLLVT